MKKKRNSQKKIINELKNQLLIQAERLGVRERYTPVYQEEIKVDSARRILGEFYTERSNLEYELNMLGSKKKEVLIKLERLNSYVRKAETILDKHGRAIEGLLEKGLGDVKRTRRVVSRLKPAKVKVAV